MLKNSLCSRFIMLCILFLATSVHANTIEIIPLKHRTAQELLPIIQPMLPPESTLTGENYQLFVKTTPEFLAQLREIIRQLDKPRQALLITVKQRGQQQRQQTLTALDTPLLSRSQQNSNQQQQQLTVLDGNEAFIHTGEAIPITTQSQTATGTSSTVTYKDVTTGFYVIPRLMGEQVVLTIKPQQQTLKDNQRIAIQHMETTITAPLNTWVEIGVVSTQATQDKNVVVYGKTTQRTEHANVLLKVEKVP